MDIDLLERCRAGDAAAFRGIVSLWGDQALKVALRANSDRRAAETAVRDAFLAAWWALPSLHSEQPFRPWLMRLVVKAATGGESPDQQIAAIIGARTTEQADRAVRAIMLDERATSLRQSFYDDELAGKLATDRVTEVRREIDAPPDAVWAVLADPHALPSWVTADDIRIRPMAPLAVGARIIARGAIADKKRSRDDSIVTRVVPNAMIAWTTRSRVVPFPAPIEFRWSIALEGTGRRCDATHRLHGVAMPPGPASRVLSSMYQKLEGAMTGSMHRGIERLAALAEQRARNG